MRTLIQEITTQTGPFNGAGVDVSQALMDGMGYWTLVCEVRGVTPSTLARFAFEDSLDNFSTAETGPSFCVDGATALANIIRFSWASYDWPDLNIGIATAQLRLRLVHLSGGSLTWTSWLESSISQ